MRVLAFPDALPQAQALARALGISCDAIEVHVFPDGESLLRLPPRLPERIILFRSLNQPNAKLVELMLAARTARRLGAREIILIVPYLCYMRQDMAFLPGEAISQAIIGEYLAGLCDTLITVDPHLHRVAGLHDAVPTRRTLALSAAPLLGRFIAGQCDAPLLLGPDEESAQWVRQAAAAIGADWQVAGKVRSGDTEVAITLPDYDFRGRQVVLVDDMISTGHTLMGSAAALRARGAARIDAACTHALFDADALQSMQAAGIDRVWSTDSISHATSRVALDELFAAAVRDL